MQKAEFERSDGGLVAAMGLLIILAACVGVVMLAVMARSYDFATVILVTCGFIGACALGYAFINTWRTPLLTVQPHVLTIPTFFGRRDIPIKPGHPLGEYLASSIHGGKTIAGTIEERKFVHFYTLDARGTLTELVAMHRAAPQLPYIRTALRDIAGLKIETLSVNPKSKPSGPDVSHWKLSKSA